MKKWKFLVFSSFQNGTWSELLNLQVMKNSSYFKKSQRSQNQSSLNYSGVWGRRISWAQKYEISLANIARPYLKRKKSQKGSVRLEHRKLGTCQELRWKIRKVLAMLHFISDTVAFSPVQGAMSLQKFTQGWHRSILFLRDPCSCCSSQIWMWEGTKRLLMWPGWGMMLEWSRVTKEKKVRLVNDWFCWSVSAGKICSQVWGLGR
jgi:hypothetical protein